MVEKIDRPQAPPAYQVLPSKEAKEDQSRRQEYEEGEEHYQKSASSSEWGKYRGRAMTIKPVRVPRDRIAKVLYRSASLKSGMGILEATVVWKDGRTSEPVLFLIPRLEEYMKVRLLKRGQPVPENYWAKSDPVEMGLVQMEPTSGSWEMKELRREAKTTAGPVKKGSFPASLGLVNRTTGRFQWFVLAAYLLGITILALAIIFALRPR